MKETNVIGNLTKNHGLRSEFSGLPPCGRILIYNEYMAQHCYKDALSAKYRVQFQPGPSSHNVTIFDPVRRAPLSILCRPLVYSEK